MSRTIVSVNPFRCRMWALHDRLEEHITEDACRAEIESFKAHGQLVPALGRPLQPPADFDIELIYGARRLFVARQLNKLLLVELRELSDREAILAMDIENRHRSDVSPYERGLAYATWLREGHFGSQHELAKALNVSPSSVSRLLQLAKLPSVVIAAFSNPCQICEGWALELAEILASTDKRDKLIHRARVLGRADARRSPAEVYRQLLSAVATPKRVKSRSHDEVVKDENGRPLFRIRQQTGSIAIVVPFQRVTEDVLKDVRDAMVQILGYSQIHSPRMQPDLGVIAS